MALKLSDKVLMEGQGFIVAVQVIGERDKSWLFYFASGSLVG